MTPAETTRVLAKCAAYDNRTVGKVDIASFQEAIGDLDYDDALQAVSDHYRIHGEWIMPADIRELARDAKRRRLRREGVKSEALALPSQFETDEDRDRRYAVGAAACRAAAETRRHARKARERDPDARSAMDVLRDITPGVNWVDDSEAA